MNTGKDSGRVHPPLQQSCSHLETLTPRSLWSQWTPHSSTCVSFTAQERKLYPLPKKIYVKCIHTHVGSPQSESGQVPEVSEPKRQLPAQRPLRASP